MAHKSLQAEFLRPNPNVPMCVGGLRPPGFDSRTDANIKNNLLSGFGVSWRGSLYPLKMAETPSVKSRYLIGDSNVPLSFRFKF
jgi:hypothetical protein